MPRAQHRQVNGKRHRFLRGTLITLTCLAAAAAVALVWYLDIPNWEKLDVEKILAMDQSLHIYNRDDEEVAAVHKQEDRTSIPLSEVPQHVIDAVIAVEDVRFYSHHGVDFRRIAGALLHDIRTGSLSQGASTLTQQLIKNTHLSTEKSWRRKAQEAWLAWQLENVLSKEDILELYLNYNYFGGGAYGIEAAARRYFNKPASELTLAEGALLAGVLKGTGVYAPHINLEKSIERRNVVLTEMAQAGFISEAEAAAAQKEPVRLAETQTGGQAADCYVDAAMEEAADILDTDYDTLACSGYRIYTYLDSDAQEQAWELMDDDTLFPADEGGEQVEAAVVLMGSYDGGVAALIGGRDYVTRGFNRAVDALRQPGSAIKPVLVFGPALDRCAYTAATLLLDEPVDYGGYSPQNFSGTYSGWVTVRQALVESINVPAVRVLADIGLDTAMEYAEKSGIPFSEGDRNLSIALGGLTDGVSPLTLARSYLPLSNGGYVLTPTLIRRIETPDGEVVYEHETDPVRVLSPETSFILSDILTDVVLEGTGRKLRETGIPLAAKTGTVSDGAGGVRDAWIAAYNPEYVLTVWMGFDHSQSMPTDVSGGGYPAAIAARILRSLYENETPPAFVQPDGVVQVALDSKSLEEDHAVRLAGDLAPASYRLYEYFTPETVPTETSPYWVRPQTPADLRGWLDGDTVTLGFTAPDAFAAYRIERKGPDDTDFRVVGTLRPGESYARWTDESPEPGVNAYRVVPLHPEIIQNGSPLAGDPTGVVTVEVPQPEADPFDFSILFPWFGQDDASATTPIPAVSPEPSPSPQPGR